MQSIDAVVRLAKGIIRKENRGSCAAPCLQRGRASNELVAPGSAARSFLSVSLNPEKPRERYGYCPVSCRLHMDARDSVAPSSGSPGRNQELSLLCRRRSSFAKAESMKGTFETSAKGSPESRGGRELAVEDEEKANLVSLANGADPDNVVSGTAPDFEARKSRNCALFGVEMTPDTVAIAMVYFVQGILGLSRLAVSFFLKDDLHLDPAETAFLTGLSALPWLIKPLYGFVSDGLPLFGYRRKSYLVLCGFLGAASWAALAFVVNDKYTATMSILLSSLSVAFSDVVVDSMVVERARGESQSTSGSLQSLCWGSSSLGGIFSAYFSGYFVETYGVRFVFGLTALLPLITSATAGLVGEEPVDSVLLTKSDPDGPSPDSMLLGFLESSRKQIYFLWQTVKEPSILLPTAFIFLWQATPVSDTAMFFFTTNKLGFGPEFLGRVRLVTAVASLAGVGLYNQLLKGVSLRKMFFWTTSAGALLGFTQLLLVNGWNREFGISDEWFTMGDSLVLTVLGQVAFMPVLVLAAKLCPPGVEATLFATLMSISNGGGVLGGIIGAWVTDILGVTSHNFDNLAKLVVFCNITSLLPLPFLHFLPSESGAAPAVEESGRSLNPSSKKD